jgi:hypothetical protein
MQRPYFAEYIELLEAGGAGYDVTLAYERYLLAPDEKDLALERYLARLIEHAASRRERAVLCFVRSPMRALWMQRRFGGLHIAQLRNPRDQWGSFRAQGKGGSSYFTAGLSLIGASLRRRHPAALETLPELPRVKLKPAALSSTGAPLSLEAEYGLFILLWLASGLQSLAAAEVALDSDRVALDAAARRRAEERLAEHGLRADLSDAAPPRHAELPLADAELEAIEAGAVRSLAGNARALLGGDVTRAGELTAELAPFSRELLERCLEVGRSAGR